MTGRPPTSFGNPKWRLIYLVAGPLLRHGKN